MIFGNFGPIYSIVLTEKLDIPILKFLLILYSVCWNLIKNILIWRRPFLPCVKSSSLNFYFYMVWAKMTLFFRSKHWKNMRVKVLMRPCYAEKFHQENHNYIKKICHFHCTFVAVNNIFFLRLELTMWSCAVHVQILGKNKICNFYVEIKYLLNFKAFKNCMSKVLESFQEHLIQFPDYLDSIFLCKLLFKYFPRRRKVNIYLDNPKELCMVRVKKSWLESTFFRNKHHGFE